MAVKTDKFFRIATEGATSDGRVIERADLIQMAKNYDPKLYGARINMEHIRGYSPDGPFKAYGDVLALKTEEIELAGKKKLALFAQLDPTTDLVALTKARQKIYSSMEIQPDFADTKEAYLVGLAVTDNPASLGCEVLQFSATAKVNPLAARKQSPGNLFTEAVEVDWDFSPASTTAYSAATQTTGFAESIRRLFTKQDKTDANTEARFADTQEAIQTVATQVQTMGEQVVAGFKGLNDQLAALKTQSDQRDQAFNTLRTGLESTQAFTSRPPATGGDSAAAIKTDC